MIRPNLFLIGAPKCGTTAIAEYLSDRSDVFFSKPKEPLFWCTDLGAEPHALRTATLAEYEALFATADPSRHKIIGEGTTAYLRSPNAIRDSYAYAPDAKYIAILRNPVDVAHAFHMEQLYTGFEKEKDFALAWADQTRREAEWDAAQDSSSDSLLYRRIASFAGQIEAFFAQIPENQRLVLIYDEFRDDPRAVWLEISEFLELEDDGRTEFLPRNAAHAQRFPRLSHFLLNPPKPIAPLALSLRKALLSREGRLVAAAKGFLNVKRPRPILDARLRAEMAKTFRPDVDHLETLLERDLTAWKGACP